MGRLVIPDGAKVYLDANIVIHIVEGRPQSRAALDQLALRQQIGTVNLSSSALSLAEVLVKPIKDGNTHLVQLYEDILQAPSVLQLLPISLDCLIAAAELRCFANLKLPDAIHMAAAAKWGADFFLSEDQRIRPAGGLQLLRLDDFTP